MSSGWFKNIWYSYIYHSWRRSQADLGRKQAQPRRQVVFQRGKIPAVGKIVLISGGKIVLGRRKVQIVEWDVPGGAGQVKGRGWEAEWGGGCGGPALLQRGRRRREHCYIRGRTASVRSQSEIISLQKSFEKLPFHEQFEIWFSQSKSVEHFDFDVFLTIKSEQQNILQFRFHQTLSNLNKESLRWKLVVCKISFHLF